MDDGRRDFLKTLGLAAIAMGGGFSLLRDIPAANAAGSSAKATSKQWGMIVDINKCFNESVRRACADACHREHNVPTIDNPKEEIKWIWSELFENAFPEQVHPYTTHALAGQPVLVLCNHCSTPGCVKVCPTQATWKRKSDGIVMMDMHRCIGCRYCMAACPYGARSFNYRDPRPYLQRGTQTPFPTRTKGVVEKCNFCAERLRKGEEPACVVAANNTSGGQDALIFGDLSDSHSKISQVLNEKHTLVRKVGAGTGPNVFYIV